MNKDFFAGFRGRTVLATVLLFLFVLIIPSVIIDGSAKKDLAMVRAKLGEVSALSSEYVTLKTKVDAVERKGALGQASGVVNAFDGIMSTLGVKDKIKSVKAVGSREMKGSMSEESAEVRMERTTMNEMVNIFSKIEDAPMILSVKRVTMKKSFENPELLDITMTVSLFTKK